ncbi:monooxygenase [Paramarasmius palmivorus]|uniref:Monooxygenase n=1 Tax=Paramarasmius palmivorus TaxID=297713 RepID=A0AAW0DJ57_9AGAR
MAAEYVQRYLEAYADHFDLNPHIQLQTSVTLVERDSGRWKVKLSTGEIRLFDLLVASNGHYRVPRYPDVPGLDQWLKQNKAMHSAWYRRPQEFGKTVLVIGAGPSGLDISSEMAEHAEVVIHSVTGSTPEQIGNIKRRGRVSEFRDDGQVVFEDGLVEKDIDYCILATGYEMSFPFLPDGVLRTHYPPAVPPIPKHVFNSTYSVFPLAKHIFPLSPLDFTPNSIAFMGLLIKVAPLPLVEAQARMIVHAFAHPEALDSTQESIDIVTRYEAILAELGGDASTKSIYERWHVFKELEQFDYRDELYRISDVSGTGKEGIEGRVVVADWEKEMYIKKGVLRKFWVDLEKKGVAEDWVKDVGKGGLQEWVDLMKKILREAEKEEVEPDEKSKL